MPGTRTNEQHTPPKADAAAGDAKAHSKIILLTFPPEISGRPMVCNLVRRHDVTFNILQASITPRREGYMTLELMGTEQNIQRGMEYLKETGIRISRAAQTVGRDEDRCVQCGACTAICPADALVMHEDRVSVVFDPERCTACGRCVPVCPVGAMHAELED